MDKVKGKIHLDSGFCRNDAGGGWRADVSWTYSRDVQDRLGEVRKDFDGKETDALRFNTSNALPAEER